MAGAEAGRGGAAWYAGDARRAGVLLMVNVDDPAWYERALGSVGRGEAAGVVISAGMGGYQAVLRAARELGERVGAGLVGVHCPSLRPQDLLCRISGAVGLAWVEIPPAATDVGATLAAMRSARDEHPWDGVLIGALGDLEVVLRAPERVAFLRESGQFDVLAGMVSGAESGRVGSLVKAFRELASPLEVALVSESALEAAEVGCRWWVRRLGMEAG